MTVKLEGDLVAGKNRFGIVVSRFNEFITSRLLDAALDAIRRHGGSDEQVAVAHVPGSFEMPLVAQKMAASGDFDAVICLGCVVRGGTGHYEYVASEAAKGIAHASMATGVPVIFGVITADTIEQAIERAGAKAGNAGAKAAISAIEMANLLKKL